MKMARLCHTRDICDATYYDWEATFSRFTCSDARLLGSLETKGGIKPLLTKSRLIKRCGRTVMAESDKRTSPACPPLEEGNARPRSSWHFEAM